MDKDGFVFSFEEMQLHHHKRHAKVNEMSNKREIRLHCGMLESTSIEKTLEEIKKEMHNDRANVLNHEHRSP
jgi:superoxide dismutase